MSGVTPPLPRCVFMAWCLFKHRDNFTFTFTGTALVVFTFIQNIFFFPASTRSLLCATRRLVERTVAVTCA
jgi:hypothetical protein